MPDREGSELPPPGVRPLLDGLADVLELHGVPHPVVASAFQAVAEAYAAGHLDGARAAVGEIAPVAERHGLRLLLGPALRAPADGSLLPAPNEG